MKLIHHGLEIVELPAEWLDEAGMAGFVRKGSMYSVDINACRGKQICEIRLEDVAPVCRAQGVAIFNNDKATGLTAQQRVVSILRGFLLGAMLPPVEVVPLVGDVYKYKLVAGVHRFYCSLAVGFKSVPAVEGFDWASLDTS
jgi:hypothetical protein